MRFMSMRRDGGSWKRPLTMTECQVDFGPIHVGVTVAYRQK